LEQENAGFWGRGAKKKGLRGSFIAQEQKQPQYGAVDKKGGRQKEGGLASYFCGWREGGSAEESLKKGKD